MTIHSTIHYLFQKVLPLLALEMFSRPVLHFISADEDQEGLGQ